MFIKSIFKLLGKQILDSIGFTDKMGGSINSFEIKPIDKDPVQVDILLKTHGLEQVQGLKEYILKNDVKQGSVNGLIETQNFTNIANQAHGFIGVNAAIKEYNLLIDKADGSSQKFVDTISKSNAGLGKYLSGLNGAKTGILSYGVSLVGATVKTIALEAATTALNAVMSFGVSLAIQGLIGLFTSFITASSKATEELQEQIEKHDENIQKIDEEISKLESEKDKLESVKASLNDAIGDKQKLADVQSQLNEVLGYTPNLLGDETDAIKNANIELEREIALKEEAIQKEKEKRAEEEKSKQKSHRDLYDDENIVREGMVPNEKGWAFRAKLWNAGNPNDDYGYKVRKNETTGEIEYAYYKPYASGSTDWGELDGYSDHLDSRKQQAHEGWAYLTEQYTGKLGQGFALQILDSLVEQGYGSEDITKYYENILKSLKADIDPLIEKYYQTGSQEDYDALRAGLDKVGGMYWQHNQLGAFDTNLTEDALSLISKAFEAGTEASKEYEDSLASVASVLKSLSEAAESLKPLQDAYKELTEDGSITNKTLSELYEEFKDVSGIDGYIQRLSSANLTTKEAQQILGELAVAKIEDKVLTGELKNATEDQIAQMLKEAGVTNSVAVAYDLVRKRKLEGILASDDYAYASGHVKDALVDELEKLGLTETAVGELSSAYQSAQIAMTEAANKQLLDRLGLLESELETIQSVAEAYALLSGKDSWTSVDGTKYSVDVLEDSYQYSNIQDENFLATRQRYEKDKSRIIKYAQLKEDLQKKIDDVSKVKNPKISSGSSKGGGSDKNEALDNYLKAAESRYKIHQDETMYVAELDHALKNLCKTKEEELEIEEKIRDAYKDRADNQIKDIEHRINLKKNLYGEDTNVVEDLKQIQQIASGAANEYRNYMRELGYSDEIIEATDEIQDLQKTWWDAQKSIADWGWENSNNWIDKRNEKGDWALYGDSEYEAWQRVVKWLREKYPNEVEKIHEATQKAIDARWDNSNKWISDRNTYNDWKLFDDSEVDAWERVIKWLKEEYPNDLEKIKEAEQNLFEARKDQFDKAGDFANTYLDSHKTLLQSYYDVTNAVVEAQHDINKELETSKTMYEYLDEDTRKLLFNQEDYNELSEELIDIQYRADKLQKQYQRDLDNSTLDTIESITSNYQMQYETLMKSYEIAKADLEIAKKKAKLNNVLNERNVRMFINGSWQWVANTEDVANAKSELADAEYAKRVEEAGLTQQQSINNLTKQQDELGVVVKQFENGVISLNEAVALASTAIGYIPQAMQKMLSSARVDTKSYSSSSLKANPTGYLGKKVNMANSLYQFKTKVNQHADGTRYTPGGLTWLGEEEPEVYITANGRLVPINQPTIGNIGAGGVVFNQDQMKGLRTLWDMSNLNFNTDRNHITRQLQQIDQSQDNRIIINGMTISEQGNEDWIEGLRRYVYTHKGSM